MKIVFEPLPEYVEMEVDASAAPTTITIPIDKVENFLRYVNEELVEPMTEWRDRRLAFEAKKKQAKK